MLSSLLHGDLGVNFKDIRDVSRYGSTTDGRKASGKRVGRSAGWGMVALHSRESHYSGDTGWTGAGAAGVRDVPGARKMTHGTGETDGSGK